MESFNFFPVLLSSHHYPSMVGALPYPGSLLYLWPIYNHRCLVADLVIGCRVVNVVLRNRVYDAIQSA